MSIIYGEAAKDDIDELIRLRIAYMIDDFGSISEHEILPYILKYYDKKVVSRSCEQKTAIYKQSASQPVKNNTHEKVAYLSGDLFA